MHSQLPNTNALKYQKPSCLQRLLYQSCTTRQCLTEFLAPMDILQLLLVNRNINRTLLDRPDILNRLYYLKMLQLDKTLYYDFYYESDVLVSDRRKIAICCSNGDTQFHEQIRVCSMVYSELLESIGGLIREDKQAARDVVNRIFQVLREPDLPLPKLRKDNIGTYCETSLQTMMALANWDSRQQQPLEPPFLLLKQSIIDNQAQILESLKTVSISQMLDLRHRAQLLTDYNKTQSPLINTISLIILLTRNQVESYRKLVNSNNNLVYDWLVEFNLRFGAYRNSLIEMEEQLGFLFEHFSRVFDIVAPRYSIDPSTAVWRVMLKQWAAVMQDIHKVNTQICGYLFIKEREMFLKDLVEFDDDLFNSEAKCKFMKAKQLSQEYHKQNLAAHSINPYFQSQGGNYRETLLRDYREYSMDISLNEIRVHWCGHTSHSVSRPYLQFEQELLKTNQQYYLFLMGVFGDTALVKAILEKQHTFLGERVKLTTMVKIIRQINEMMECSQQQQQGSSQVLEIQLDNFDEQIDFINTERHISREFTKTQCLFLDITEHISLDLLEKLAKQNDQQLADDDDQGSVQSYISSEGQ